MRVHEVAEVGLGIVARRSATFVAPAEHRLGELDGPETDVRQANEYATGHLPDTCNVELGAIPAAPLDAVTTVTVMCGPGERATSAASLRATRGAAVRMFDGGLDRWATATGRAPEVGR